MDTTLFIKLCAFSLFVMTKVIRVYSNCASSQCGGRGECVSSAEGWCRCDPYYAGEHCEECVVCGGQFSHVWSCVECEYSADGDREFCRRLLHSNECNNVRVRFVFDKKPEYNLVHSIEGRGHCMLRYGVQIKAANNNHLEPYARVYLMLDCN